MRNFRLRQIQVEKKNQVAKNSCGEKFAGKKMFRLNAVEILSVQKSPCSKVASFKK